MGNLRSRSSTLNQWAIWGEAGLPLLISGQSEEKQVFHSQSEGNLRSRSSTLNQWAIWGEASLPLLISGQSEKQAFHSNTIPSTGCRKADYDLECGFHCLNSPLSHPLADPPPPPPPALALNKYSTLPIPPWLQTFSLVRNLTRSPPPLSDTNFSALHPPLPPHPQSECYFPIASPPFPALHPHPTLNLNAIFLSLPLSPCGPLGWFMEAGPNWICQYRAASQGSHTQHSACTFPCKNRHINLSRPVCIPLTNTHQHTHTHTHIHTCIHTHAYTHTHINLCHAICNPLPNTHTLICAMPFVIPSRTHTHTHYSELSHL